MALRTFQSVATISSVDHLKQGMVIVAYLGLDKVFDSLDREACDWIKAEFSGAKTTILRQNVELVIKVENLRAGDTIQSIFDIPDRHSKYTTVDADLIAFLKEEGFSSFQVSLLKAKQENPPSFQPPGKKPKPRNNKKVQKAVVATKTLRNGNAVTDRAAISRKMAKTGVGSKNELQAKHRKPVIIQKDEFLIGLKRAEDLRVYGISNTSPAPNIALQEWRPRYHRSMSRQEQVDQANEFLESMRRSIAIRSEAVHKVEEMMDKARQKKVNWSSISYYIDFVMKNSTTTALAALANIKASDQTYGHCIDVASIFCSVYLGIIERSKRNSLFKDKNQVMLAAFLHDFGKSQIPKEIIESDQLYEWDSEEMRLIRSHPTLGAKLLTEKMNVPNHFINMALYHHVKYTRQHKNSYPRIKPSKKLPYVTQLLSIVDVYQALVGKRSYKKAWSPAAAVHYLKSLAGTEFDREVFNDFRNVLGDFPMGSVVKLNDASTGLVVSVPETNLARPNIIVVKDSQGNDLKSHPLVNLKHEKNLYITQDIKPEKALGNRAEELVREINVS